MLDQLQIQIEQLINNDSSYKRVILNNLGAQGAERLAAGLEQSKIIRVLNLAASNIGDAGVKHIMQAIKHTQSIEVLNLSSNCITDKGAQDIADVIKSNSSIVSISLARNKLGVVGRKALADAIMHDGSNIIYGYDLDVPEDLSQAMKKRKRHIEGLVDGWLEYKNDQSTFPDQCIGLISEYTKYRSAIKFVVSDSHRDKRYDRADIANQFDQDLESLIHIQQERERREKALAEAETAEQERIKQEQERIKQEQERIKQEQERIALEQREHEKQEQERLRQEKIVEAAQADTAEQERIKQEQERERRESALAKAKAEKATQQSSNAMRYILYATVASVCVGIAIYILRNPHVLKFLCKECNRQAADISPQAFER